MENSRLQVFNNQEFGQVRAIEMNGEPWFVGKDIADALGYSNPRDAIAKHVFGDDKGVAQVDTPGGMQWMTTVNESGLYGLIFGSELKSAKEFKRWVTSEVLPSIRKNGGYIQNQENLTPEQIVANALVVAQNIINNQNKQIETMKPKAEFFDAVADSKTAMSMDTVAKVLEIKGFGRNNLFKFLREEKVLGEWNRPYQEYVDRGWFRVIEQTYTKNGEQVVTTKTLVYQKGVDAIRKLIRERGGAR